MNIIFTNMFGDENNKPLPASLCIPEWYKNTDSYLNGQKIPTEFHTTSGTIKKCLPVFDSITSGYIIFSSVDLFITQKEAENGSKYPYYQWPSQDLIQFHSIAQAPIHPKYNGLEYPKWINNWSIKTPNGYSCLFVTPFHRDLPFTILPGIVDTDKYNSPVNFPFVLNDISFEGLIPAGTPIAQVIPFKRDSWQIKYGDFKNVEEANKILRLLKTKFFDGYKKMFWTKKEFK